MGKGGHFAMWRPLRVSSQSCVSSRYVARLGRFSLHVHLVGRLRLIPHVLYQASDGAGAWRQKAELMLVQAKAGSARSSRFRALASGKPQLGSYRKQQLNQAVRTSVLQETTAESENATESAESTEFNETASSCPPSNLPWGTSFECWLASYEDPEDIEDWMKAHRASHKFSHAQWYEDHKNVSSYGGVNTEEWYASKKASHQYSHAQWYEDHKNVSAYGGVNTEEWYAAKKNASQYAGINFASWYADKKTFGNFSWPDWVAQHGLRAEMKVHARLEVLAQLSSKLDGYAGKEDRCGLECWMAQFRHRDQLDAVHRWFKSKRDNRKAALMALEQQVQMLQFQAWYEEHKSYGGPEMNTETWYANHKNYTPSVAAWYEEHKSYGGPEMNTETWYANHKNYTPSVAAWYEEHKSYGGPEMNTETWYANHKNYTPSVAAWYEEHKSYGGPEMNTETWYANHKNYTPSVAAWYEEHKSYGGPEMNTETWYANHKNYTPSVAAWYEEHKSYGGPEMNTETWYANHKNYTPSVAAWYEEHKSYGGPEMNTETWYANHKNGPNASAAAAQVFERADMVRAVLLWEVVRSIEEHSLLKKLKASAAAHAGANPHKVAQPAQLKQRKIALSTVRPFSLDDWLKKEPHAADLLSLANVIKDAKTDKKEMTQDVSHYLDSKTSLDLDQWLASETLGRPHEKNARTTNPEAAEEKTDNVLATWLDRHSSPAFGHWLQSFSRMSSPFRAAANSRLAENALSEDKTALHQHAEHSKLVADRKHKVQSLQEAVQYNTSGDPSSPKFDFETWWAQLGQDQEGVAGSNWTKMVPEKDSALITSSDSVGAGACCCGFACEEISNECCGAWYPSPGGESYIHYGSFKQNPRSVAALSARADAARLQQRSALAQVSMLEQLSSKVADKEVPELLAKAAETEGEAAVDADEVLRADSALRGMAQLKAGKARLASLHEEKTSAGTKSLNAKAAIVAAAPKATNAHAHSKPEVAKKLSTKEASKLAQDAMEPVTTKVHQAFGDKGFLGWMCQEQAAPCTGAPVRVGATCEVECLSSDGVDCMSMAGKSCGREAAQSSRESKFVQCGAKMAKASGSNGYDDPEHWCHCAQKQLASQISTCKGDGSNGGVARGVVFANGLKFGSDIAFASGDKFGDDEVFGSDDSFGSLEKFGSMCLVSVLCRVYLSCALLHLATMLPDDVLWLLPTAQEIPFTVMLFMTREPAAISDLCLGGILSLFQMATCLANIQGLASTTHSAMTTSFRCDICDDAMWM